MAEWRALTQGGCLAGNQTFQSTWVWQEKKNCGSLTVPHAVTKLKFVTNSNNSVGYVPVTPGATYTIYSDCEVQYASNDHESDAFYKAWYLDNTKVVTSWESQGATTSVTIYWSNAINQS